MEGKVEDRISKFICNISCELKFLKQTQKPHTNLTILQKRHINLLRNNRNFVILMADKNLGPAIMERDQYIKHVLKEHLCNGDTYQRLSRLEGESMIMNINHTTMALITKYRHDISKEEQAYFIKSLYSTDKHRIPQFYGTPKVHKEKIPTPFRPVVSQCGSISAILSTFIDYKLQHLTKDMPSYLLNSTSLLNELDNLGPLPPSARIFTSDAVSMYSNIDPSWSCSDVNFIF